MDYALIAGLAVAVWGAPPATKDIDRLLQPADRNTAVANAGWMKRQARWLLVFGYVVLVGRLDAELEELRRRVERSQP